MSHKEAYTTLLMAALRFRQMAQNGLNEKPPAANLSVLALAAAEIDEATSILTDYAKHWQRVLQRTLNETDPGDAADREAVQRNIDNITEALSFLVTPESQQTA